LVPGGTSQTSIVEIFGGASVSMSALTVRGPGSGTCDEGALNHGIQVRDEAHLDFSVGAVRDIHDSPMAPCFRSGTGILVGDVPGPPASVTIRASQITNYQTAGIVVVGFGSLGTISQNIVRGPGHASGVATDGIEFPVGSVGTISHNVVSGNVCPVGDESCGPDWFTQFQHAGILAGGWGPGTVVSNNYVFGNQIGLFLGEADDISNNLMIGNELFGLGLINGTFRVNGGQIVGGGGGLWAIADAANTNVALHHVNFARLSGPKVEKLECCGFTATVTGAP
ncbi:MAG: right-handed parallel beta-helix repeat-containing protein, partial [Acidimicrobiales bacterium]